MLARRSLKQEHAVPANILAAMDGPQWWRPWFARGDWTAWRSFLAATFALPMDAASVAIYEQCTGRKIAPSTRASEVWAICGRRGGKTRIMATVAAWLAAFVDWRPYLSPGEVVSIMLIAANRKQARVAMRYLRALFLEHPTLAQLIASERDDALELSCRVTIEVLAASFRTTRGYSIGAVIADELAFWLSEEDGANPADEIIAALRPGMATLPGSLLMVATSPYARRGPVYQAWRQHYGKDGDPILVWKAPSRVMNPLLPQGIVDAAMEADPIAAAAEYLGEFRSDVESFVSREVIEATTVPGRFELPPASGISYCAFTDPSGGSSDSFTLGVAHRDQATNRVVLDAVRERRPPFSPEAIVAEFATLIRSYGISTVTGDRYAGEWPRERFREHGVHYEPSTRAKSELYQALLPMLNSGQVELLDHPRLHAQLVGLERRTARGGRDSIDHAPGGHDDLANAVAGALAGFRTTAADWVDYIKELSEAAHRRPSDEKLTLRIAPDQFAKPKAKVAPALVTLRTPLPFQNFCFGAGRRYSSDADALIANVPPDDAKTLIESGCTEAAP
ncbi:MAG TPA: hypothetical protein VET84_03320 [Stellaceae bacterium]|nr:hypothetical protein [Stellaceae bacterium]